MPYTDHPEIPPAPADDTVIWQYLSVAELLDLLDSSAIHLTRADSLATTSIDVESQVMLGLRSGIPAEMVRRSFGLMSSVQTAIFTSCWYSSGSAFHSKWEGCGGGKAQIAIRSTVKGLQAAVSRAPQRLYISAVQYIDFAVSVMPTGNVFFPALHKDYELRDEREVRLLMLQTGGQKIFSPGPSCGIDLPIDLHSMIHGIRLAPHSAEWLRDLVHSLAERYGLTCDNSNADLTLLSQKRVCRFKSADGCDSCNHSFVPVAALHKERSTPPLFT